MARPKRTTQNDDELTALYNGLIEKLAYTTTPQGTFGGVSFEDAIHEVIAILCEQGLEELPKSRIEREGYVLGWAVQLFVRNKRRERDHEKALILKGRNEPVESLLERILIDDEVRRIIALAWAALNGKQTERVALYVLASGVDKKDTQLLAKYLKCSVPRATKVKTRVIKLLRTIALGVQVVDSNGDSK